jgi:PKD domain/Pectate lyase superfamily protein
MIFLPAFTAPERGCIINRVVVLAALVIALAFQPAHAEKKKKRRSLDVTEYGAVVNDGIDDGAGIAAAINLSTAGDTLFFPPGTYQISAPIEPNTGTILLGDTVGVSTIRFEGFQDGALIQIDDRSDVEVGFLVLDGSDNPRALDGIVASASKRLRLHHLRIRRFVETAGFGPHGIYFSSSVTDAVISDNIIEDIAPFYRWGAGIRLAHGSSRNQVLRNTISNTGRGGIVANDGSTDLVIRQNVISRTNGTGLGIELWNGCNRAVVEDNTLDHWLSLDASDYVAVRRNVITDPSGKLKFAGLELAGGRFNVFTDNVVDEGAKIGISVSSTTAKEYNFWAYNTIRNASRWGAQIQGETSGASFLYFYSNRFENSGVGSTADSKRHGFRVNGDTHFLTLEENFFIGNQGLGLQISGDNIDQFRVLGNTFTENTEASAEIDPDVSEFMWSDNSVSGNGLDVQPASRGVTRSRPLVSIRSSTFAVTGESVSFESKTLNSDERITNVLWDFEDGIPATDNVSEHIYTAPGTYRVSLIVWDESGESARAEQEITVFGLEPTVALGQNSTRSIPLRLKLLPNYPNPFDETTELRFRVPGNGPASLKVHDILGRNISTLFDGPAFSGRTYEIEFRRGDLGPGVYFYTLWFNGQSITRTMLVN